MAEQEPFECLQKNGDGLYAYGDLRQRIADAMAEYDRIVEEYGQQELPRSGLKTLSFRNGPPPIASAA